MIDLSRPVSGPVYICGVLLRALLVGAVLSAASFGVFEFVQSLDHVRLPAHSELAWLFGLAVSLKLWLSLFGVLLGKAATAFLAAPLTARRALTLGMSAWHGVAAVFFAALGPGGGALSAEVSGWELALSPPIWLLIVLAALGDMPEKSAQQRFGVAYRAWNAILWLNVIVVAVYGGLVLIIWVGWLDADIIPQLLERVPVGKLGTLFALLSMCLLMIDRSRSLRETPVRRKLPAVALQGRTPANL